MEQDLIYSIVYVLLCAAIIYPPAEFVSAGFTIPVLFSKFLGSENDSFIHFHLKRSLITLMTYSLLPFGYIITIIVFGNLEMLEIFTRSVFGNIYLTLSLMLPIAALYQIKVWTDNNYEEHPIAKNLSKFCNNGMNWRSIQTNIDIEFRRPEKMYTKTNPLSFIAITENWILKITPLTIYLAHQSDTTVTVKTSQTYNLSPQTSDEIQYLNIEVKSSRPSVEPFIIRINSENFLNLQDRLTRTINVMPDVKFHKNILERFVDVFKENMKENPRYESASQVFETCIGCMEVAPNVKIQKMCTDESGAPTDPCSPCYCQPMWCADCMAKWFASRQDSNNPSSWLSSKCTCPMCRAKFCLLDVCYTRSTDE